VTRLKTIHLFQLLWMAALALLIAIPFLRVTTRLTRFTAVILCFVVWFGFVALIWRRRTLRYSMLSVSVLIVVFLVLPGRSRSDTAALRDGYIASLRRYNDVPYVWGGEGIRGIDCSGLVRRGMVDVLFRRGLRTCDPGLVRRALFLWWRDCTAWTLGWPHAGLTGYLFDTPNINVLDHSQVLPGDLAVHVNGTHVMAYLGSNLWIQADPRAGRVTTTAVPAEDNPQFYRPMRIVRWRVLQE
jgi:hypothetical protein